MDRFLAQWPNGFLYIGPCVWSQGWCLHLAWNHLRYFGHPVVPGQSMFADEFKITYAGRALRFSRFKMDHNKVFA